MVEGGKQGNGMPHRVKFPEAGPRWRGWLRRMAGRAAAERDLMFHLAPGLQLILGTDQRVQRCNPAWKALLGWTEQELLGRHMAELQHPDDVRESQAQGRERLDQGLAVTGFENRLRHRDGSYRRIRWYARRLPDGRTYGFGQDVTESAQTERERDLFFSLAPGLQGIVAPDGTLRRAGHGWQAVLGYDPTGLLGHRITEWVHPDDIEPTRAYVAGAVAQGRSAGMFVNRYRHADGQYRWIQWYTQALTDTGELYGFGLDITGLTEAQARFRSAFDHAAIGISLVSLDGHFIEPNASLCRLLGYTREEMQALTYHDITHPPDLAADERLATELAEGRRESYTIDKRYITKSGHLTWIQLTGSRVLDADGKLLYFIAQVQDINERKRTEERLRIANRELEAALADLRGYEAQMRRIHELSQLLMVCADRDEAYQVMQRVFNALLGEYPGFFAVLDAQSRQLVPVFHWGARTYPMAPIPTSECWAMRRGEAHRLLDAARDLPCGHVTGDEGGCACIPLTVNGRTNAMVHVAGLGAAADMHRVEALIETLGEVVKTSLSNLDLREHLSEQAIRDRLTGLYNRRHLDEQLPIEFERARRKGQPVCLAMVDIDHFKHFNDDFGHEAGDEVLRAIGRYLRESLRKVDLVFRYGGEEFTLILSEADATGAAARLDAIREGVKGLSVWYGGEKLPTPALSIGVAFSDADHPDPDSLIRAADRALYRAKETGRDRVVFSGGP